MPIDPQRMAAILQQVQRTGGAPMPSSPPPAMPPQGMPPRPMTPPGGMRR